MPVNGRRRRDSWSEDDGTATAGPHRSSAVNDAQALGPDGQPVPALTLTGCKSGGGWAVGPVHAYLPSHEDQLRIKAASEQSGAAALATSSSTAAGRHSLAGPPHAAAAAAADGAEAMPAQDCYVPPGQDNGEDDRDTFVDKGSTAALEAPADPSGNASGTTIGAAVASAKKSNRPRPAAGAAASSSSPVLVSSSIRFSNTVSSSAATAGIASSPTGAANTTVAGGGTGARPSGGSATPPPHAVTSASATAVARRGTPVKAGAAALSSAPHYSRLNSSEAAPGVVYRATLAVRAIAMDPEQPVLWAAVGDDPLAALRVDSGELTHSRSVKDIEQVHCMAVVRIAEELATTFKSASASPRASPTSPKSSALKGGRRSKKNGRRSASTRKSGKLGSTGAAGSLVPLRASQVLGDDDDDDDDGNSDDGERHYSSAKAGHSSNNNNNNGGAAAAASSPNGGRDRARFANYLWCGLSRGHLAVVNMATLEYQMIHNAHAQTVNKIWYWEARNKVWTAGREKGVHVWDPQRRVVLKKRNIAAILTDATYAENADKIFAVADDPCVRVFEPGGENVNVPKGQENRIKMKSDASVIAFHRNSGLVWVGLARGSVLMNPISLDVERTLPFTFSAILFDGDRAILAGQESQNSESRLMVLDVTNAKEPTVLAYAKFTNPLAYGIHVIPHTCFAVAAQDDPKKGTVVVIFVYAGTATVTHAITAPPPSNPTIIVNSSSGGGGGAVVSKYPEQRTEKVVRAPTMVGSPSQPSQQPLSFAAASAAALHDAPSTISPAGTGTPAPYPGEGGGGTVSVHGATHAAASALNAGAVSADRQSLHRATVVKHPPEARVERKFNVEADHSTLVEAIGPEAQEIKSALKHLVKTTDEVRQSLVQQRSAEATLADFSRLLRGRQQWLQEQGPIVNLPVLPPHVMERVNREYVTPEGKSIATAIEQLQQMLVSAQVKLEQQQQQAERQQQQDAASDRLTLASPHLPSRPSPRAGSPLSGNFISVDSPDKLSGSGGGAGTPSASAPWAAQLAATLQRERALHEQQMSALQLKTERLAERNAALGGAFSRLQAHVAALGRQGLAALQTVDSTDSTTVMEAEEHISSGGGGPEQQQQRLLQPLPPSQQAAAAALFQQLRRGKYHKPKYVRHSTEMLERAMDEVVRLTQLRASAQSRDRDVLGGTAVMLRSSSALMGSTTAAALAGATAEEGEEKGEGEAAAAASTGRSLALGRRYTHSPSPSPEAPTVLPADGAAAAPPQLAPHDLAATVPLSSTSPSFPRHAAVAEVLAERPITSFRGACAMAEVEVGNLRSLNAELVSLWARLQNSSHQGSPGSGSGTRSVDGGMLLSLADGDARLSSAQLHLMEARVLQAVCWAECGQTVLRELTSAGGLESPFLAGGVRNPIVSGVHGGGDGQGEVWQQGPLQVLDYESVQERTEVLGKVGELGVSGGMELPDTSRIRETLLARCRASKEGQGQGPLRRDAEFLMHRLPGALHWSHVSLRLLFEFLEHTDELLSTATAAPAAGGKGKARSAGKGKTAGSAAAAARDALGRTASAVGVAMTHWALFLLSLRAELLAVHHATRLYHAWCWGAPAHPSSAPAAAAAAAAGAGSGEMKSGHAAARRTSKAVGAAAAVVEVARSHEAEAGPSLAEIASSLTSRGKLLLLYMQWCLAGASAGTVAVPALFTADYENDAASTTVTHRPVAECANALADAAAQTAQLLQRVSLLLSYCHALRARALAALGDSSDPAMAQLAMSMCAGEDADAEVRAPTEQEKAFLRSSVKGGG